MKLAEMRRRTGYDANAKATLKDTARAWLRAGVGYDYQLGITLMPKKMQTGRLPGYYKTKKKYGNREMNKREIEDASARFCAILNKLVLKNAHIRFGKKLNTAIAIEGERSAKDLHIHIAVGNKPHNMTFGKLAKQVRKAIRLSGDFEMANESYREGVDDVSKKQHYKIDIIDSGWMEYITKELPRDSIDNLLLL